MHAEQAQLLDQLANTAVISLNRNISIRLDCLKKLRKIRCRTLSSNLIQCISSSPATMKESLVAVDPDLGNDKLVIRESRVRRGQYSARQPLGTAARAASYSPGVSAERGLLNIGCKCMAIQVLHICDLACQSSVDHV